MNKEEIISSILRIKESIAKDQSENTDDRLITNFQGGLRQCDKLVETVTKAKHKLKIKELFCRFDRYVSDCLPWTDELLITIENEKKRIIKFL